VSSLSGGPNDPVDDLVSVMFAELYGALALHSLPEGRTRSEDAYSLFYRRSAAMGWLTPSRPGELGGMWGMNEAEVAPASGPDRSRVAWFQVVRTHTAPDGVPVQAFLACIAQVIERMADLRLDAAQFLLPADPVGRGQAASREGFRTAESLLEGARWFADVQPSRRAPVRVTVDGGAAPAFREQAEVVARWLGGLAQDVFVYESVSLEEPDHLVLGPMAVGWQLESHNRVTFCGTLAEWSLDAIGWLAAFIADGAIRNGVSSQLGFAVERTGGV